MEKEFSYPPFRVLLPKHGELRTLKLEDDNGFVISATLEKKNGKWIIPKEKLKLSFPDIESTAIINRLSLIRITEEMIELKNDPKNLSLEQPIYWTNAIPIKGFSWGKEFFWTCCAIHEDRYEMNSDRYNDEMYSLDEQSVNSLLAFLNDAPTLANVLIHASSFTLNGDLNF